ncbi:MAG: 50S ribosomal protein L35 [Anaerolineae bacterium]|nr:50S ribosomal protein L35 [Anaerolineae bacterium]
MPKIKTHKPTSKRFRISKGGNGKLMRTRQGKSHFRRKKARRTKAELDEMFVVESRGLEKRIRRLAPHLREK